MNVIETHDRRLGWGWLLPDLLVVVLLACLAPVSVSQDNDGDGVLPNSGGCNAGAQGSGGAAVPADWALGVHYTVEPVETPLVTDRASVTIQTVDGVAVEVDWLAGEQEAAILATAPDPIEFELLPDGLRFQGQAGLMLGSLLDARIEAAPDAMVRTAVLLVHERQAWENAVSMADVLSGAEPADFALVLGDVTSLDLVSFRDWVAGHGLALPDATVTVAFVSIDLIGDLHVAGVRVEIDGTGLEVSSR